MFQVRSARPALSGSFLVGTLAIALAAGHAVVVRGLGRDAETQT